MFLNNNVLTVAGSLSNGVISLTINGQAAAVYHDLTWAVTNGVTLANGLNQLTALVVTNTGGVTLSNSLVVMLPATVALRYDADGNLTWDGLLAYTYDCADELTAVTLTNAWKTGYVYDGLGRRRIRKDYTWSAGAWAETNEVHYVYAGMNVLQERNSNNVPLVTYTRGIGLSSHSVTTADGLLARTDANGPAYYHDDANGNVTALVNGSGTVVAKYLYDSFGNTLGMWGSLAAGNTYRFSSKEMDVRTGQYYYGYRWYDPNLQRWLNRDPIQEAGGINLYGYVGNNPEDFVDPYGLADWDDIEQVLNDINDFLLTDPATAPEVKMAEAAPEEVAMALKEGEQAAKEAKDAYKSYEETVKAAEKLYPKKCGKFEDHHKHPIYLRGDPKGPTVRLPAAYYQLITNMFRQLAPYGQPALDTQSVQNIVMQVYSKYPLPPFPK